MVSEFNERDFFSVDLRSTFADVQPVEARYVALEGIVQFVVGSSCTWRLPRREFAFVVPLVFASHRNPCMQLRPLERLDYGVDCKGTPTCFLVEMIDKKCGLQEMIGRHPIPVTSLGLTPPNLHRYLVLVALRSGSKGRQISNAPSPSPQFSNEGGMEL
jgi:hypothetical protein